MVCQSFQATRQLPDVLPNIAGHAGRIVETLQHAHQYEPHLFGFCCAYDCLPYATTYLRINENEKLTKPAQTNGLAHHR